LARRGNDAAARQSARTACATAGLARAGLLDGRDHTSAAAEYLAATGYAGGGRYVDQRAIVDGELITAGPQSPVQFARATLGPLGVATDDTLDAYERLFDRGDASAFPVLMQGRAPDSRQHDRASGALEAPRCGGYFIM
jgi:DJ-1/PfpI family